jgi:hypothetical protein
LYRWVETSLDCSVDSDVNVFEVTIRIMGGLLSAYHFSQEDIFLTKVRPGVGILSRRGKGVTLSLSWATG